MGHYQRVTNFTIFFKPFLFRFRKQPASTHPTADDAGKTHSGEKKDSIPRATLNSAPVDDQMKPSGLLVEDTDQKNMPAPINRGLSKSMMIIPTPVSELMPEEDETCTFHKGCGGGQTANEDEEEEEDEKSSCGCMNWINNYLDLSLLSEPMFILMCLSVTLMSVGSPYMLYYLPAYVLSAGYTKADAGYLVAISAAWDLTGRLGFGYLSDLQLFDRRKAFVVW